MPAAPLTFTYWVHELEARPPDTDTDTDAAPASVPAHA